jgi:hypothetical protein
VTAAVQSARSSSSASPPNARSFNMLTWLMEI